MDFLKKTVEQPALETKIKSDEVKIQEIALGYFLAPFCAMLANSIFGAYLTRYYADVLGWTKFGAGAFAALLPIVSGACWGLAGIFVRVFTEAGLDNPTIVFTRTAVCTLLTLLYILIKSMSLNYQMSFVLSCYKFQQVLP